MKTNNICKFSPSGITNEQLIFCFVLETDQSVMKQKYTLKHHRMILIEQGDGTFLFNDVPFISFVQIMNGTFLPNSYWYESYSL